MRTKSVDHAFVDWLLAEMQIKNDKQLAEFLELKSPVISKIRHGQKISSDFILKVHEKTDIPVKVIRQKLSE